MKNILVCGAGQGGHAIAAYTSMSGFDVTLYTHTPRKAEIIKEKGNVIHTKGMFESKTKLKDVVTELEGVVSENNYIFIVSDATAHKYFAEKMAKSLSNQKVVLVSPGVGGALSFYKTVKELNPETNISVSETDTLVYACKVPQIGTVTIKSKKNEIIYTTIPKRDGVIDGFLNSVYPEFKYHNNPLMGLDDSPVFHIVGMINNSGRILNREDFNFYIDGITPDTADYMEKMDLERCAVAEQVGLKPRKVKDWLGKAYNVKGDSLYEMIQKTPPYQNTALNKNRSPAPKTLFHRYLMEEIPLRAVPTVEIAKIFGIKTPMYDEMIDKACILTGIDFRKIGRNISDMGLTGKDIKRMKEIYS